jgi:hypothetical protein
MKKRILAIALTLVLAITALAPAAALAAKPVTFHAAGFITYIEDTQVGENAFPAGESGRWRVIDREIGGEVSGDINGSFRLTYQANVELATQAGNMHGVLVTDGYSFKVNGKIQALTMEPSPLGFDLPVLTISGHWNLEGPGPGQGDFEARVQFVPDEYGHVVMIVASSFEMQGKW